MTQQGWGGAQWGAGEWGAGVGGAAATTIPLQMISARAIRENVVRVVFDSAPVYNKLLDLTDASNPARFQIVTLPSTGLDGEAARDVLPVLVEQAAVPGALGRVLDVWVDRPFSPWPSRYLISANQLQSSTGSILSGVTSLPFNGVYRELRVPSTTDLMPSRDIASPQTYSALASSIDAVPAAVLGTFPIDESGDYAFDSGVSQLKKRVYRRFVTTPGGFPANPDYGVGVLGYGSQLSVMGVRQRICDEARQQITTEPDVQACKVTASTDPKNPNVTIFAVRVQTTTGIDTTFTLPFSKAP